MGIEDGKYLRRPRVTTGILRRPVGQSTSQPSTDNRIDGINKGLLDYSRTNAEHDILVKMEQKLTECKFVEVNGGICHIRNKSVSIDETPKGELFPENDVNIFPGAIVYADEFLAKGTPRLVNFGKQDNYGSVLLSPDFDNGGSLKEKVKISASAVKDGIAKLLRTSYGSSYQPSGQYSTFEETYSDVNKMAIEANCSVDFLVKCNVKTNTKQESEKIYKMKKLTQQFYKVSAEIENGNLASVFGPDVTWNDVQEALKEAPIAIITEVTYGRYGYFFSEYESSHFNFVGSQDISYKSNKIDLKQDIDRLTKSTKKWGYVYGGSANTAAKAVSSEDEFITQMNSTPNVGPTNQGRPLSYTVVFLSSDKPCKKFNTGSYYEPTYTFLPKRIQTWIHNGAKVVACTKLYVDMWYKTCYIHPTTKEIVFNNDNNGDGIKWNHGFSERGLLEKAITLRDGLFFQPEAHIRITHQHAAGASWNVTSDGYVDISNGTLTLEIGGSGYRGQQDPHFVEEKGKQTLIR